MNLFFIIWICNTKTTNNERNVCKQTFTGNGSKHTNDFAGYLVDICKIFCGYLEDFNSVNDSDDDIVLPSHYNKNVGICSANFAKFQQIEPQKEKKKHIPL